MTGELIHSTVRDKSAKLSAFWLFLAFCSVGCILLSCIYWAILWYDTASLENSGHGLIWIFSWIGRLVFQLMGIASLSFLVCRGFSSFFATSAWRFRLGFICPLTAAIMLWIFVGVDWSLRLSFAWLSMSLLASFFGGLAASALETSLWEDNAPPSDEVKQRVYQFHQAQIGDDLWLPAWKRGFDLVLVIFGLVLSVGIWFSIALLIWLEDPGPLFFVKNSVGAGGINFRQLKFRSMAYGAEDQTGPVMAKPEDERVLFIGKLLRKTALDELPQLLNILLGQMSFVGPRPQRTVLVDSYLPDMPEYAVRHRVLPGLSGLAQVAGDYYLTPRQKLRFDRLYIQHSSLGFDLKLLFLAGLITFGYRWQSSWDGRLPRWLLHHTENLSA